MEYVKICGLKNLKDIETCIEMGADAIGFIYRVPESPRNLEKNVINDLLTLIDGKILTIGVIKPQNIEDLVKMMSEIYVDLFQLHLLFEIEELMSLPIATRKRLIVVLRLNRESLGPIIDTINEFKDQFNAFLIDNSEGKGKGINIDLAEKLVLKTQDTKIILAGGIGIDNIELILKKLKVHGIDASSSLESERGIKDPVKITEFLEKIKEIKNKIKSEE